MIVCVCSACSRVCMCVCSACSRVYYVCVVQSVYVCDVVRVRQDCIARDLPFSLIWPLAHPCSQIPFSFSL